MNFVIWLAVGGLIGWAASFLMHAHAQESMALNTGVGVLGAVLTGWLVAPLLGLPTINDRVFGLAALLVALGGAVVLLAFVNLVWRGSLR